MPAGTTVPERLRPLLDPSSPVQQAAERVSRDGHHVHHVGGAVGDPVLGVPPLHHHQATAPRPEAIERAVKGWADSVWLQGQRFGTVGCEKDGVTLEITTFRAEIYRPESRKPEVTYSDDIETDLSRRDFTINAMALELPELRLVDPFGGIEDLAARRPRPPPSPAPSTADDPLRMLRAARVIASLSLTADPELLVAVHRNRERLAIVSPERIRDELSRLLVLPDPSEGLWVVVRSGLADQFLPELPALGLEQDPIHRHKDVLAHTIAVVAKTRPELRVRLAALLHDVGKPRTRAFGPQGVTFHHHEVVGARMARERLRALRFSNEMVDEVTELVRLHLRFHTYRLGWTDRAVRRYARDAGPLLDELNDLVRCDCTTQNRKKAERLARRMDELEADIERLREQEELDSIRPPLDGNQVMAYLGVRPGPVVGEALGHLLELRLDEGPMSEEEAFRRLAEWARSKGLEPA